MIRKLMNAGLAATLIVLPMINVGKAKAQNANVDAYLFGINQQLDLYINTTAGAKNSGLPGYEQTIKSTNCTVTILLAAYLQDGIIRGAISHQNPLYQDAAKKINELRQMSGCSS